MNKAVRLLAVPLDCRAVEHVKCLRTRLAKPRLDGLNRDCLLSTALLVHGIKKRDLQL